MPELLKACPPDSAEEEATIQKLARSRHAPMGITSPPGCLVRDTEGELRAEAADGSAPWTLNALTDRAQQQGIQVQRSQVRRILLDEGVRWRSVRS
jgi:transposase